MGGAFDWQSLVSKTECQNLLERLSDCIFNVDSHSEELFYSETEVASDVSFTLRDYLIRNALRLLKSLIKSTFLYNDPKLAQVALNLFLLKKLDGSLLSVYVEYSSIKAGSDGIDQRASRFEGHMLVQSLILENIFFILKANSRFLHIFQANGMSRRPSGRILSFISISVSFERFCFDLFNFLFRIVKGSPEPICALAVDILATFFSAFKPLILKNDHSVHLLINILCAHQGKYKLSSKYQLLHYLVAILSEFPIEKSMAHYSSLLGLFIVDEACFFTGHEKGYTDFLLQVFAVFDSLLPHLSGVELSLFAGKFELFLTRLLEIICSEKSSVYMSTLIMSRTFTSKLFIAFIKSSQAQLVCDVINSVHFLVAKAFEVCDETAWLESMNMLKSFLDLNPSIDFGSLFASNATISKRMGLLKLNTLSVFSGDMMFTCDPEVSTKYFDILCIFLKHIPFLYDHGFSIEFIQAFEKRLVDFRCSPCFVKLGIKALELFTCSISNLTGSTSPTAFSSDQVDFYFQIIFKALLVFPSVKSHSIRAIGLLFSILDPGLTDPCAEINILHALRILKESISVGEHKVRWNSAHAVEIFFLNEKLVHFITKANFCEILCPGNILNDIYSGLVSNIINCQNLKVQLSCCKALNCILKTYIVPCSEMKQLFLTSGIFNRLVDLRLALSRQNLLQGLQEIRDKLVHHLGEATNLCKSNQSN